MDGYAGLGKHEDDCTVPQVFNSVKSYVVLGMNINFMMVSEHKKRWHTLQECAIAWMAMTV